MAICACGCGESFDLKEGSQRRYLNGHQFRVPENRERFLAGKRRNIAVPPPDYPTHGFCLCGCGQKTPISTLNRPKDQVYVGFPIRYIRGHNPNAKGPDDSSFIGRRMHSQGYWMVYAPNHPAAWKAGSYRGYVPEHRLVWEQTNGRSLNPLEHVHHINGDRADNRPENLVALSASEHRRLHRAHDNITDETRRKLSEAARRAWADGRMRKPS